MTIIILNISSYRIEIYTNNLIIIINIKILFKGPLNFPEDTLFSNKNEFNSGNFNIDFNLLLVLNFYKHLFYLIQNNKIDKYTLFSYEEIVSLNENYKKINMFVKI